MRKLLPIFLFALLSIVSISVYSSDLLVRGQIKGLTKDDRKTVPVVLSQVSVTAVAEGAPLVEKTNLAGFYTLELKRDRRYLITVHREGYHDKSIWINTKKIPQLPNDKHVELTDLDFLLMKKEAFPDDVSGHEDMGQLYYDLKKKTFELSVNSDYRQGKVSRDNSLRLLRKTITYTGKDLDAPQQKSETTSGTAKNVSKNSTDKTEEKPLIKENKLIESINTMQGQKEVTTQKIESQRSKIDSARAELEYLRQNAVTREDTLNLEKLEAQLKMLEVDLAYAEEIIGYQNDKISNQEKLITIYIVSSILLLSIMAVVFYFYRHKLKMNKILEEKNEMIMDGINYANTIQRSFLKNKEEINEIIPGFVMLFRPRDIVSGDFYWLSEVNGIKVIAAIDCTGHGVPGAFISMIGNTLLNEIVNNKKILNPGKILEELHKGVMIALRQDADAKHAQDGMDMALITVDERMKKIQFAGARNHLYVVKGDKVEVVKANIESIGGRSLRAKDGFNKKFDTKEVSLDKESTYYMASDGIIDQFGGPEEKKFNLINFVDLLKDCAKLDPEGQSELLHKTFDDWKGDQEQLDDVLVVGAKFS